MVLFVSKEGGGGEGKASAGAKDEGAGKREGGAKEGDARSKGVDAEVNLASAGAAAGGIGAAGATSDARGSAEEGMAGVTTGVARDDDNNGTIKPEGAEDNGSGALVAGAGDQEPHPAGCVSRPNANSPIVSCADKVNVSKAQGDPLVELVVVLATAGDARVLEGRPPKFAGARDNEPQTHPLSVVF